MHASLPGDALATVLDALPDPALLINSNGTVLAANSPAHHAFQAPGTVLVGLGVLDLLPELDPRRIPGSMRPAGGLGPVETLRTTARRTDATTFPAEVRTSELTHELAALLLPPVGPEPPTGLLLLTARDLTELSRAHAELARLRTETETVLRTCSEGVLGIDTDGNCVLANPAALHLLRYRAGELAGLPLRSLLPSGATAAPPAVLAALATGRRSAGCGTLRRKDGVSLAVDLRAAPLHHEGRVVGAVLAFTDRGRELSAAAGEAYLTAVLRNDLGPSTGALADRLHRLAHDPAARLWPEAIGELRQLSAEFARSRAVVEQVLDELHRPVAPDGPPRTRPVALHQVLQRAADRLDLPAGVDRVRLTVHTAAVEVGAAPHPPAGPPEPPPHRRHARPGADAPLLGLAPAPAPPPLAPAPPPARRAGRHRAAPSPSAPGISQTA
ncbi:PAS domain-containing protein [Kitasatospora sp. NPDC004289]